MLINSENGAIHTNNTLKRLFNTHSEEECIQILFSLKNASLPPITTISTTTLNNSLNKSNMRNDLRTNSLKKSTITDHGMEQPSSIINYQSYINANSLFTIQNNRTFEDHTNTLKSGTVPTSSNVLVPPLIHSTCNSNSCDVYLSKKRRRNSTSS